MTAPQVIRKYFDTFRGLDKSKTDLTLPTDFAIRADNVVVLKDGSMAKRKGSLRRSYERIGTTYRGLHRYGFDGTTSVSNAYAPGEELVFGNASGISRLAEGTLTVTYSGAAFSADYTWELRTDSLVWNLELRENGIQVYQNQYSLIDAASPDTMADVVADITAVTDWSAAASATTDGTGNTILAAYLPIEIQQDCIAAPHVATYYYPDYLGGAGSTYDQTTSNPDYTNPSMVNLNNVVYIGLDRSELAIDPGGANGSFRIYKYDGLALYQAGLPELGSLSVAAGGGGAVFTTDTYKYRVRYTRTDYRGNVVEGELSSGELTPGGGLANINLTIGNLQGSVFNAEGAIVNGNQVGVNTITVNSGHTFEADDIVYFQNQSSGDYIQRTITSTTATTIVIDGGTVDVNNADVISNDIRIQIYRTLGNGNTYYLVEEIPNDALNATQVYSDTTSDTNLELNETLIEPQGGREQPPAGSFLATHQNLLFVAGNKDRPNRLYWSDITSPEHFLTGENTLAGNAIDIPFSDNGAITAMASDRDVFIVFKENGRAVIRGDFATGNIFVEVEEDGTGCPSHASIAQTEAGLMFCSNRGPERTVRGVLDETFGIRLRLDFVDQKYTQEAGVEISAQDELKLVPRKAIGFYDFNNDRFHMFVPAESGTPSSVGNQMGPNANSRWYVFDLPQNMWSEWPRVAADNPQGGFAFFRDTMWWASSSGDTGTNASSFLIEETTRSDARAFADTAQAIDFRAAFAFEALGEPSILKRFNKLRIFVLDGALTAFDLTVNTFSDFVYSPTNTTLRVASFVQSFTIGAAQQPLIKLARTRAKAWGVEFRNNEIQQQPKIQGYELGVRTSSRGEMHR